jgi:hypothetical protein
MSATRPHTAGQPEYLPEYLIGRVLEALAEDPRTHVLDLQVRIAGGRVILLGVAGSVERRRAAVQVAREVVPREIELVSELCVPDYAVPPETETLP